MQVLRIRQTTSFHNRGCHPFSRTRRSQQAHCLGVSGAVPLFELREGGIFCPR
jgi:hypothetical protein